VCAYIYIHACVLAGRSPNATAILDVCGCIYIPINVCGCVSLCMVVSVYVYVYV
jgi:hypothetical protein